MEARELEAITGAETPRVWDLTRMTKDDGVGTNPLVVLFIVSGKGESSPRPCVQVLGPDLGHVWVTSVRRKQSEPRINRSLHTFSSRVFSPSRRCDAVEVRRAESYLLW